MDYSLSVPVLYYHRFRFDPYTDLTPLSIGFLL
jgi:hypothetical protein